MLKRRKILAVIPARGGSKGIPRKNIKELAGKPLIAWTIEEAKKSKYIDRLILSSEDPKIIKIAKQRGCEVPFRRPKSLAQDNTPGVEPVLHALKTLPGYDYVVLLQPTSPLRKKEDIDGCIECCIKQKTNACVTVAEVEKSPYWMFQIEDGGKMKSFMGVDQIIARRQDIPKVYALNGAVYCARVDWLFKRRSFLTEETIAYCMPQERSVDIDSKLDFILCERLLNKGAD